MSAKDTPRTDAEAGFAVTNRGINRTEFLFVGEGGPFVSAHFARTLERQLAQSEERVAKLEGALKVVADEVRAHPESPRSFSGDSYLPQHIVDVIRAALQSGAKERGE